MKSFLNKISIFIAFVPFCLGLGYELSEDSKPQDGVPKGKVTKHQFTDSEVYPGTVRDYWVYVPHQYDKSKPTCLMVFQDGAWYQNLSGHTRAPIVFDNLIHKKEIPVIIGVFVNPGIIPPQKEGAKPRKNRSLEYDTLNDQYSKFLLNELLPEVQKKYHITEDPLGRSTCGISSGGICAWTVAWERPDKFSKVISYIGSFTNIRGGHNYPAIIRKTEKKPIRVFLQEGENDLDNLHGSWPLANRQMAAALKFSGYDYKFVMGDGAHNGKHGGSIFPDMLRWLWRDYSKD